MELSVTKAGRLVGKLILTDKGCAGISDDDLFRRQVGRMNTKGLAVSGGGTTARGDLVETLERMPPTAKIASEVVAYFENRGYVVEADLTKSLPGPIQLPSIVLPLSSVRLRERLIAFGIAPDLADQIAQALGTTP